MMLELDKNTPVVFFDENKEKMMDVIYESIHASPKDFKEADHRFQISHFFMFLLEEKFGSENIRPVYNKDYDFILFDRFKISVKTQTFLYKMEKPYAVRSRKAVPIQLKNNLSNTKNHDFEFDYLLGAQRHFDHKRGICVLGFSLASLESTINNIINKSKSDQTKVLFKNNEDWDYFSGLSVSSYAFSEDHESIKSDSFKTNLRNYYKDCRHFYNITRQKRNEIQLT